MLDWSLDSCPTNPVRGLLALMLFTTARRPSRIATDGSLVPLADQDRGRWDPQLIEEARGLVRTCLRQDRPGQYQLHAAINTVHTEAATFADTDWRQILASYDRLMTIAPTPVVELNRAVAVAEIEGPEAALTALEHLGLAGYYLWNAVRADLTRRCGRSAESILEYQRAIDLTDNPAERQFLRRRLGELSTTRIGEEGC